jgi:hypothetical protein
MAHTQQGVAWQFLKIGIVAAILPLAVYAMVLSSEVARLWYKGILPAYILKDSLVTITAYVGSVALVAALLYALSNSRVFLIVLFVCALSLAALGIAFVSGFLSLSPLA